MYLGRKGALGRFTLELAQAAARAKDFDFEFIVSSNNNIVDDFLRLELPITELPTFDSATPSNLTRGFFKTRRFLKERFAKQMPFAVLTLMPHVWSPLLVPQIKKLGAKYLTIIHDADPHPGDRTAWVTRWLSYDAKHADLVITLSRAVAQSLIGRKLVKTDVVLPLFHPDMSFDYHQTNRKLPSDRPLRILFFGRVMAYKGLPLLIDAVEDLRRRGLPIQLGVVGSGDLGPLRERLEKLDAEVINRWIDDREIGDLFNRFDAMACSHVEASQSGVASAAFGSAMPVIAMPVGGIAEQVIDGGTGVLARRATSNALADAIYRLAKAPGLYDKISRHLVETGRSRSMDRFLNEVLTEIEAMPVNRPK